MRIFLQTDRLTLRRFTEADEDNLFELNSDPEVMRFLNGGQPTPRDEVRTRIIPAFLRQAQDWVDRQRGRLAEGAGFSFTIAEAGTGRAVGGIGLWLASLAQGRATAGYSVIPSARGRGIAAAALTALTGFAWSIPALHRIELYIEPWNVGSITTAERARAWTGSASSWACRRAC